MDSEVGGARYTGLVLEHGGDDRRLQRQQREELFRASANAPANYKKIGPHKKFQRGKVPLQALAPLVPGKIFAVTGGRRGLLLVVDAVELDMAELAIGDKDTVVKQRRADAGPQGDDDHQAGHPFACAP